MEKSSLPEVMRHTRTSHKKIKKLAKYTKILLKFDKL